MIRTDFSEDAGWESVCEAILAPTDESGASLIFVNDREYDGLTGKQLITLVGDRAEEDLGFVFIVDRVTMNDDEMPILAVDLYDEPGRTLRLLPAEVTSVQTNLANADMSFEEFADAADSDGVFRGF